MKKITIILALTIITTFSLTAQNTYVPDDNFEQALIDLGYDTGGLDDYVLTANIESLTTLDVSNKNIADLTGIEDFTALQILQSYQNQLTSLDISANNLYELDCSQNLLTSLDASANVNLYDLFCYNNQLTSLNVSANVELMELHCHTNLITSLDVTQNTILEGLVCFNNQLTYLDVRNGNNETISDYNSANNPDLSCIFVENAIYSIDNWPDVDPNSTFVETQALCEAQQRTYVPDDNFEQALIDLGYDSGALDDYVPTANIENLTSLNVSNKNIADLTGIEDFISLTSLRCYTNQITSIDISDNTNLEYLNIYDNELTSLDVSTNIQLTTLSCSENQLTSLDISANINLTELSCSDNQLTSLDISTNLNLTDLYCKNNSLINLDISAHTDLFRLNCSGCQLTGLNVRNGNNSNFTYFNASNNPNLSCVFVDDAAYSTTNWIDIDAASTFVETEAECDALVGVDEFVNSTFTIYPNPVKDSFTIQTELDITFIEIYDVFGKLVKIVPASKSVIISELQAGVYFVKITTSNGSGIHKIIKR